MAADRARHIVEYIKDCLEQDKLEREKGNVKGFSQSIKLTSIQSNYHDKQSMDIIEQDSQSSCESDTNEVELKSPIKVMVDNNTVASFNKWKSDNDADDTSESSSDEEMVQDSTTLKSSNDKKMNLVQKDGESSEEEERQTMILN
jgi:hypothetical protein